MQLLVKKKEPKHTHTKITKQEKPTNQPTNPPSSANLSRNLHKPEKSQKLLWSSSSL